MAGEGAEMQAAVEQLARIEQRLRALQGRVLLLGFGTLIVVAMVAGILGAFWSIFRMC